MGRPVNRYIILLCGTVSMLLLGLIYAWSIFAEPLEAAFGWTRAQTSVTFMCAMLGMYAGMLLAGALSAKISAKAVLRLGTGLIFIGFLGSSMLHTLLALYLFYGVFCRLGIGLCYNTWLPCVLAWFQDRSGLAAGIMLTGFGMGGMVLGVPASALMYSPFGWRRTFLSIGLLMVLELVLTGRCLLLPTAEKMEGTAANGAAISPRQMLTSSCFYLFTLWKCGLSFCAQSMIGQAASVAMDAGATTGFSALTVGFLSVGNGLGRTAAGLLNDRIGSIRLMCTVSLTFGLSAVILIFAYPAESPLFVAAALTVVGVAYGGVALLASSFVKQTYGLTYYKTNYGIGSITAMPVTLCTPYIGMIKTSTGSYQSFFYLMLALCACSALVPLIVPGSIRRLYRKAGICQ